MFSESVSISSMGAAWNYDALPSTPPLSCPLQEWAALDSNLSSPPCAWVHVGDHAERHDPSHLVTHRAGMGLPALLSLLLGATAPPLLGGSTLPPKRGLARGSRPEALLEEANDGASGGQSSSTSARSSGGCSDSTPTSPSGGRSDSSYLSLLLALDAVASHEVDAALASLAPLNEPQVARQLSRQLPPGHALFLGNSMPIRDMDMYAAPWPSAADAAGQGQGGPLCGGRGRSGGGSGIGMPIAANRGASGIDGVLSTAAGTGVRLGLGCPTLNAVLHKAMCQVGASLSLPLVSLFVCAVGECVRQWLGVGRP